MGIQGGRILGDLAAAIDHPVYPPGGPEKLVLSICRECPAGCGIRVRCVGNRVVKVDGNPLHPISGGRLCPKGQTALQSLYHPDRIAGPLRRVGPRGSLESFRPATWEEALNEISVRLSLLRQQDRPEALVLLRGPSQGIGGRLAARFMQAFGSPNDIRLDRGAEAASQALFLTQGIRATPAFDLRSAEYALSLGSSLLEASESPVFTMRAFGDFRQGRSGRRGKFVHVGPRLSGTAAAADEWVPVRKGTEGVLALGLAGALVAEGLYDKEFVLRHTHGFEDSPGADGKVEPGLRRLLKREFSLERVSAETGVSVNRILRIAREFAAARPGLAFGPRRGNLLSGGLMDHLAAHLLNALAGNVDGPGGLLVPEPVPLPSQPGFPSDPLAEAGRTRPRLDGAGRGEASLLSNDPEGLAESILSQDHYRAEALFILDADPVFTSTAPGLFLAAMEQVPLVVSFAALPDDSSLQADWILPHTHPLESWDLDLGPDGVPFPLASLAIPALEKPLCKGRPAGEVFLDLARRLGSPVSEAFPWPDLPTLIREETRGLFQARRGAVIGTGFDEAWVRLMERAGWWAPGYRTEEELWTRIQETGGWWDPFYDHWHWNRVFQTGSGRFEFRPDLLAELDRKRRLRSEALRGERPGETASPGESLALHLFEPLPLAGGIGAELPFLQEILDPGLEERWETWVEIHPGTAKSLGLNDGDKVAVSSAHGSIRARLRTTRRVVPGVAAIPVGQGKRAAGRWARDRGANPLEILSPAREALSRLPDLGATLVRVVVEKGEAGSGPERRGA